VFVGYLLFLLMIYPCAYTLSVSPPPSRHVSSELLWEGKGLGERGRKVPSNFIAARRE